MIDRFDDLGNCLVITKDSIKWLVIDEPGKANKATQNTLYLSGRDMNLNRDVIEKWLTLFTYSHIRTMQTSDEVFTGRHKWHTDDIRYIEYLWNFILQDYGT